MFTKGRHILRLADFNANPVSVGELVKPIWELAVQQVKPANQSHCFYYNCLYLALVFGNEVKDKIKGISLQVAHLPVGRTVFKHTTSHPMSKGEPSGCPSCPSLSSSKDTQMGSVLLLLTPKCYGKVN